MKWSGMEHEVWECGIGVSEMKCVKRESVSEGSVRME